MDYTQYVKLVRKRAGFSSDEEALTAIRCVLDVLGERLTIGEADDLAVLLPKELRPYLKGSGPDEPFGREDFLARVGRKERIDPVVALYLVRAVLSVLASTLPTDKLIEALAQLPHDIRDFFMVENRVKKAA